jgi:LCP family protein required for cell wall assembly
MRQGWARILLSIGAAMVLILTLTGVAIEIASNRLEGNITAVDISETTGREHAPIQITDTDGTYRALNILLMGSDSRQGQTSKKYGDPDVMTGERSDTTILLHLSADRSFATAVSIPRDTWVMLPTCERDGRTVGAFEGKFNTAFEIGGPGCTVKLVEQMTGLTVDSFAVIDFDGFKQVVDALGGVEVCLTEPANDPQSKLRLPAGVSVVDGEQALSFVRARKTLSDGSDLSRIKRQQAFLSAMIREASSTGLLLNPVRLYSTLNAATSGLTTDPSLAEMDILRDLALSVRGMAPRDIAFLTMPWVERGDGENVLVDEAAAAPIWQSIADDVPWVKPKKPGTRPDVSDLTVDPADISVRVLNGSGVAGRAAEVAAALEAQGFTVAEIGDADRADYTTTEIRHDAASAEAARTVLAALPGARNIADTSMATVTIVLGTTYAGVGSIVADLGAEPPDSSTQREEDAITAPTTADRVRCN